MNFVTVTDEQLKNLREGLTLIEQVTGYDEDTRLQLTLYGLTSDPSVVDCAKEAVADEAEIDESQVKIAGEVAVAIPLSGDTLYYLTGSGLQLQGEEIAFSKGGGNGIDTIQTTWAKYRPRITTATFREMAIAGDSWSAATFLQKYGKKAPAPAQTTPPAHPKEEVTRTPGVNRAPGQQELPDITPKDIEEILD
jgi:hypothetical protein